MLGCVVENNAFTRIIQDLLTRLYGLQDALLTLDAQVLVDSYRSPDFRQRPLTV